MNELMQDYIPLQHDPRFVTWAEMSDYMASQGGGGGTFQKAQVTLTHAQILTLKSSGGVQIIPAPAAGKITVVHMSFWATSVTWTMYGNIDGNDTAILRLLYGAPSNVTASMELDANQLLASFSPCYFIVPPNSRVSAVNATLVLALKMGSSVFAKPILVNLINSGDPNGGDPGNTLTVTAYYTIEDA